MSQVKEQLSPQALHRREVRNQIMLPMLVVLVVMIVGLLLIFVPLAPSRFTAAASAAADALLTALMLCPAVLCCLIPVVVMVAAAVGLWAGDNRLAGALRKFRVRVTGILLNVKTRVPEAAKPVIALESKLASWERFMSGRPNPGDSAPDSEKE